MKNFVCITLAALCSIQIAAAIVCLPNACDNADCSAAMAEVSTCEGRIDANGGMCGCCPACIKQLNEGDSCMTSLLGTPKKSECGVGLQCHPDTKQCTKLGACHAEVLAKTGSGLMGAHLPECLEDGSYAPVQCRESVCMCVDKKGKQIQGIQTSVSRRNEMNCQCARAKDAMKFTTLVFPSTCDELGNFERVQCWAGQCYCVDDMGKKLESFGSVAVENKGDLSCFLKRRQAAVEQGECARELEMLESQGKPLLGARKPQCLEDGSYSPVQCRESVCQCVDKRGKTIKGYDTPISRRGEMNCQCARDKDALKFTMIVFPAKCDEIGNYQQVQCWAGKCNCVDEFGKKLEAFGSVAVENKDDLQCSPIRRQAVEQGECARQVELIESQQPLLGAKKPECLEDGSFHPRQCFEGQCNCVDKRGQTIQGYTAAIYRKGEMNCQCARDKDAMKLTALAFPRKCNEIGNYERVQCNGGTCFCVNDKGKKIESLGSRPEERKEELGGCLVVKRQAVEQGACARELELIQQGKQRAGAPKPQCLEDGSYHPRQCREAVCACVDSAGKPTEYTAHVSQASKMGCQCARDKADYMKTGLIGKLFYCDALGNYQGQGVVNERRQAVEQGECARKVEEMSETPAMGAHKPQCLEDGSYHPRQCREAVCTCVDSAGLDTEYSANVGKATKMGCQCARDKADYKKTGLIGKMFYCDELGNYKSQAVEQLGACERKIEEVNMTPLLGAHRPVCKEDGSFAPRQCHDGFCSCVDSEGKRTGHVAHVTQSKSMTCNCAQDKADYQKIGMVGKSFKCDRFGSYESIQCMGSMCHCVDAKGKKLESSQSVSIGNIGDLKC